MLVFSLLFAHSLLPIGRSFSHGSWVTMLRPGRTRFCAQNKNGILNPYVKQGTSAVDATLSYFREDLFKDSTSFNRFISKTQNVRFTKSDLLEKLADAHIEQLEHNVTAITIDSLEASPLECVAPPTKTLYERWWYEKLFETIMEKDVIESSVLIGTEGTSKSTFQFWVLYRILQTFHHGKYLRILPM